MGHEVRRSTATVNGIELSYLSAGAGPLVILIHGFPDLAIAWQHQLEPLAEAGYHVVAPDMRGYGASSAPEEVAAYSQFDLAGDITGLMDELGAETAVVVGHDMGAVLAWPMAAFAPQRLRGVVALSVPHKPRGVNPPVAPTPPEFYQKVFQAVGVEEADMDAHVEGFLAGMYDRLSGSSALGPAPALMVPTGTHFRELFAVPDGVPAWLGEAAFREYVETFQRTGFRGALNWYRNNDRNWYQMAPWAPSHVTIPAAFLVGTADVTYQMFHANGVIDSQIERVPQLWDLRVLEGVGHWIMHEAPDEVTAFLLDFLRRLDGPLV